MTFFFLPRDERDFKAGANGIATGQGKLGYTTGAEPGPRNGERQGFEVDEHGNLSFNGAGFIACPNSIDGAHSVWVNAGVTNPAGNKDCVGVSARTVENEDPVGCLYSQYEG